MTISSTESKTIYGGNGSTTVFAIPFMFTGTDDIEVVLTDIEGSESSLAITTDYILSGAGNPTGGTCELVLPPEAGQTLVIRRNPTITQEVDYQENDAFPASSHEAALDKLTMICQTLSERLDRTITFRVSSAISGVELPSPDAGQMLAWNDTGDNLTNRNASDFNTVLLPLSVNEGGTGGSTTDAALTNLGFSNVGKGVATCADTTQGLAALDAEQADPAILKADLPDVIKTVFSDDYQTLSDNSLSAFIPERNKIEWVLNEASTFDELTPANPVSLVFYINPQGNALTFASAYTMYGEEFDNSASEVRVSVDINGADKRVTIANAKAV